VVRGFLELDAAVTPVLGGPGRQGGFDLIAGHSGSGALGAIKLEEVARIANGLPKLAPHYDKIILDLAAGVDPTVLRFARTADRLVR
jgi:flagellar biosynthesis protein FlhG